MKKASSRFLSVFLAFWVLATWNAFLSGFSWGRNFPLGSYALLFLSIFCYYKGFAMLRLYFIYRRLEEEI